MNLGGFRCWVRYPFVYGLCLITKETKQGVTITLFITGWVWFITFTFSYLQVCNYYCVQLSQYFSIYLFFIYLFKPRCLFFFFLLLSVCLSHSISLSHWTTLFTFISFSSFFFSFYILSTLYPPPPPPSISEFYLLQKTTSQAANIPREISVCEMFLKKKKRKEKNISLLYNIPLCEA